LRSLALYFISIPCFAFLRKYTLYPTCRLLLIDLPRTADYNYKGSISSSGPLPVQESWNHMQDLKHVFSYLKPYRRDLFLAVGLVFVECIFEMVIPMLMSDLVDQGVPSHDMQVIMLQGSKMIICAVLALITGLLYARFAARAANGFAAAVRFSPYVGVYKRTPQQGFVSHLSTALHLQGFCHLPSEGSVPHDRLPRVLLRSAYLRNRFPSFFSAAGSR